MIEWIILGVMLLAPLVYLVIHYTWGKKWEWPAGTRVDGHFGGYTATLIYGEGVEDFFAYSPQVTADACALGVWSIATCWDEKRNGKGRSIPKQVIVHVLVDEAYHKKYDAPWAAYNLKSNGMLQYISRRLGKGSMPVVACRASTFVTTPTTGSLVVHELVHYVGGDNAHEDKEYWDPTKTSLEAVSRERFISKREQIGIKL